MNKINIRTFRIPLAGPEKMDTGPVFRAAVLSDLHDDLNQEKEAFLLHKTAGKHPDAVFCTGDLVSAKAGAYDFENVPPFLKKLRAICPVYVCQGNHELRLRRLKHVYGDAYDRYEDKIRSAGIRILDNETVTLQAGDTTLYLTGYSLPLEKYSRCHKQFLDADEMVRDLGKSEGDGFHILLAHHPDYFAAYTQWGADLVLAGHLHGGIIRLPLLGGVFGGTFRPFPRYDKGEFFCGSARMIVSAGLGSHFIKLRINNPEELIFIDFI